MWENTQLDPLPRHPQEPVEENKHCIVKESCIKTSYVSLKSFVSPRSTVNKFAIFSKPSHTSRTICLPLCLKDLWWYSSWQGLEACHTQCREIWKLLVIISVFLKTWREGTKTPLKGALLRVNFVCIKVDLWLIFFRVCWLCFGGQIKAALCGSRIADMVFLPFATCWLPLPVPVLRLEDFCFYGG